MVRIFVRDIGYLNVGNYSNAQRLAHDIARYKTRFIELDLDDHFPRSGKWKRVNIRIDDIILIEDEERTKKDMA